VRIVRVGGWCSGHAGLHFANRAAFCRVARQRARLCLTKR
jgi:hypothetical protein